MLTKKEHIDYWLESAQSDWESVSLLFDGGKYVQGLFFCHLVLEKISKALLIKLTDEIYPPKIHDIVKLLQKSGAVISDEHIIFLRAFNTYNLEGRYPDYMSNIYRNTKKDKSAELIQKVGEIRECLLKMI